MIFDFALSHRRNFRQFCMLFAIEFECCAFITRIVEFLNLVLHLKFSRQLTWCKRHIGVANSFTDKRLSLAWVCTTKHTVQTAIFLHRQKHTESGKSRAEAVAGALWISTRGCNYFTDRKDLTLNKLRIDWNHNVKHHAGQRHIFPANTASLQRMEGKKSCIQFKVTPIAWVAAKRQNAVISRAKTLFSSIIASLASWRSCRRRAFESWLFCGCNWCRRGYRVQQIHIAACKCIEYVSFGSTVALLCEFCHNL